MEESTPFIDMLFNMLLGFAFLFMISFLLIQPIIKKAEVSTQAEFVVTVTWPLNNTDDVDVWLEDPVGNLVFFRNKAAGLMHLDRDDLGSLNDTMYLVDGSVIKYPYNQEILTIRGFVPGEWVLNVHMYKKREKEPTSVRVTVDKLNPKFKPIILKTVDLSENWQEETIGRLEMTSSGEIMGIDLLPKKLVKVGNSTG